MYKDSLISFTQRVQHISSPVSCADPSTEANSKRKRPKNKSLVSKGVNELLFKKTSAFPLKVNTEIEQAS